MKRKSSGVNTLVKTSILGAAILFASSNLLAEVSIVVHPSNGATPNASIVGKIFLGKVKKFPGGGTAMAVDQAEGSATRAVFQQKIVKKNPGQYKSYWSKMIFTGKGQPPKAVGDDAAVIDLISSNPATIGYVDSSAVTDGVKVILTIP